MKAIRIANAVNCYSAQEEVVNDEDGFDPHLELPQGGTNGGHVRFEIVGEDKLQRVSGVALPFESNVGAGMKIDFTIVYRGLVASSNVDDIVVTATFTENVQGATQEQEEEKLTCVQVELTTETFTAKGFVRISCGNEPLPPIMNQMSRQFSSTDFCAK